MLLSLSLSARVAPLEIREPFAFGPDDLPEIGELLLPHVSEALIVSTCQRFEAYVIPRTAMAGPCLAGLFARYRGVDGAQLSALARFHRDRDAAAHLFQVAAGLESEVLGEAQVLGQIGRSLEAAREAGLIGHRLGSLVQTAIGAGRRVRLETGLGRGALSVPRLAVDLARRRVGDLAGRTALLVGAGETGQLAAKALDGVGRILIANRTPSRARDLAGRIGGEVMPWAGLAAGVAVSDLIVCCATANEPIISRDVVAATQQERAGRPLVLVDLAVPRGIEPSAAGLPGVTLLTVEDLRGLCQAHEAERRGEIPRATAIVERELERTWRAWEAADARTAVVALRGQAEAIRRSELERIGNQLQDLSPDQGEVVEHLTRAIVNKLLHQPTMWLKSNPTLADNAVRDMFGIGALS